MPSQDAATDPELRAKLADSIATLLARLLRTDVEITEDSRLMDELGLSSSLTLELLLELEDEFQIQVDVEELEDGDVHTVGDLTDYIVRCSTPR